MRGFRRGGSASTPEPGDGSMPDTRGPVRAPRAKLPRDVLVLGVIAFFVMVGFGVVVPVLPVYARSFGVGSFEIGAVISAFALMRLVMSPFVARIMDWTGERTVLAIGLAIVALSSGLAGLAQDYLQLLLLRGAGGIGSAMFSVAAMTLLLGSTDPTRRARAIGFYQGGFLIGGMAGPALGAVLATVSLTAPFFFYAATLAVASVIGLLLLSKRTGQAAATGPAEPARPFAEVLRDTRYRGALLANLGNGWASMGVRSSLIPLLVVEVIRAPAASTGIAFACAAVVQALALAPAARFVDTVGRRPAIVGSFAVAGVLMVAIPFAPNVIVLTILLCLFGAAASFMGTAPGAAVGDAAGGRSGRPVAVFSMVSDLGAIVGPLVAGYLADAVSFPVAFATGAVLLLAASAYALLRMPREERTGAPVAA
ncbi:Tetracycline resistance protein, class B [Clavibacter michiganensis]|uniref:Tetracycline resistance protein, class B n=1 Tax=Clavibacter michiganensis TaxID=28447 RepID=A0A251YLA5_9MICO|nr:MFS transporter [Clavibacter michiganensis]OUE25022.1 Tetracycline resistance protein, class B [Clavibacter michiganensis]